MILIVKLDENMPPLMVEALKHNILAAPGVQGVEWQEAAEHRVQRTCAKCGNSGKPITDIGGNQSCPECGANR